MLVGHSPESKEALAFRQGLRDAGYVEGRDVVIKWRSAGGDFARVPELVADFVKDKVDVIVVETTPAALAVRRTTSIIPIVMTLVADPVESGLVKSLAHPGENITGLSNMELELSAKRLSLLKEIIPQLVRVAVLWNPENPYHPKAIKELKGVAPSLSMELNFVSARTPEEFVPAYSAVRRGRAQALYVIADAFFSKNRGSILALASEGRLPVLSDTTFAESGALIYYGANFADLYRRSAGYVDKILKGAKPGDLPVEQPTKFELVVNLKTAKALGLTIPESILLRADEVIQ